MLTDFSPRTEEALGFYVYLLVDLSDGKIFYVGKGKGDRVFAHVRCALGSSTKNDKLDIIRGIMAKGQSVRYYIVRHGMEEREAYLVESVLIDLLTFKDFATVSNISNIQAGHHQFDRGIKTVEELESMYNGGELKESDIADKLLVININSTYGKKEGIYEATRKSWKLSPERAKRVDYVLSEYRGVVRAIFVPERWSTVAEEPGRWQFEGYEMTEQNNLDVYNSYINKRIPKVKGMANPLHYINV